MGKAEVAALLAADARWFGAPVPEGVQVTTVERNSDGVGFLVGIAEDAAHLPRAIAAYHHPICRSPVIEPLEH